MDSRWLRAFSSILLAMLLVSCPQLASLQAANRRGASAAQDAKLLLGSLSMERLRVQAALKVVERSLSQLRSKREERPPGNDTIEPSADRGGASPSRSPLDDAVDEERPGELVAVEEKVFVRARPSPTAAKLGYLRAGARVQRGRTPEGHRSCNGGWYRIAPMGYVCAGENAVLEPTHAIVQATVAYPDRDVPLPYRYARTRSVPPLEYVRVPTLADRNRVETAGGKLRSVPQRWREAAFDEMPEILAGGRSAPALHGYRYSARTLYLKQAAGRSAFALQAIFQGNEGAFGFSTDLTVLPLDRLDPVEGSSFEGLALRDGDSLPAVFVMSRQGALYAGEPTQRWEFVRYARYREGFLLSGRTARVGGHRYRHTTSGYWLRDESLAEVNSSSDVPFGVGPDDSWIDVSLREQTLVAYEGRRPVYVTLISSGAPDIDSEKESTQTPEGVFRIHTKHVTVTMSGDEPGDEYSLADVPWVQFFKEGYALHAAYWHDAFGHQKSHGCINLSPADALWLFKWSDPPVPRTWHGAMSASGSVVRIRQ